MTSFLWIRAVDRPKSWWRTPTIAVAVIGGLSSCLSAIEGGDISEDEQCRVLANDPQPMSQPDGTRLLLDPESMAVSGEEVLILARVVHMFDGPDSAEDIRPIGVKREANGELSVVVSPLPMNEVQGARASAAMNGGWHVVLFTAEASSQASDGTESTSTVWYAHFNGNDWTEPEIVSRVIGGRLSPLVSGNVIETSQGIVFAYIYDRSIELQSNDSGNQGVVLVVRDEGHWAADTLRTWEAPRSLQLTTAGGLLRVFLAKSYFAEGRPRGPSLFVADFDGRWTGARTCSRTTWNVRLGYPPASI